MKYRKLGHTGTVVSALALGTMYFASETPEDEAFKILDAYVEAEGNLIDTADVYVGGLAEQVVGRWLAARPREITDRVVLATKGRAGNNADPNAIGLSRRYLHRALDASLRRLGVYAGGGEIADEGMPQGVEVSVAARVVNVGQESRTFGFQSLSV